MPVFIEASKPVAGTAISPGWRSSNRSTQSRIWSRSSFGTPSIVVITSLGKIAEKSATTSNDDGSSSSMRSYTLSRTMSSKDSIARGVNTLLTSLRIF